MAEEREEGGSAGAGPQGDGAAVALGLAAASRERADGFLQKQEALIEDQRRVLHLQAEEMRTEEPYKLSHLRLRRFSGWAKAAFEFSAGLIALALVGVLAAAVWNAAHSDGLVIESFAVPPEMAARGLTGEVAAARLMDRIGAMLNQGTTQGRALSNGQGDAIKVEIPQTGVSIGELYRFLRRWLGHETGVAGEITGLPDGRLAVTVRVDGRNGASFPGRPEELDSLLDKAAGRVAALTQPAVYAIGFVTGMPSEERVSEAIALLEATIADADRTPHERAVALNNLSVIRGRYRPDVTPEVAASRFQRAMALDPDYPVPYTNWQSGLFGRGHLEEMLAFAPRALAVNRHAGKGYRAANLLNQRTLALASQAVARGDFAEAAGVLRQSIADETSGADNGRRARLAAALAYQHDGAALAVLYQGAPPATALDILARDVARAEVDAARGDWPAVIARTPSLRIAVANAWGLQGRRVIIAGLDARMALAKASMGDFAAAEALIAPTPGDNDLLVINRGRIAALAGQDARADWWFARAIAQAPSIPFAPEAWGRMKLTRGKPDDAIAQFTASNRKGPHFADPLEGWGEALMAKSQSHLALKKFAEAEKYAPNWGRLHLKWGEALYYAGKPAEAKAHFARAATLDLTPSEKSELSRVPHG